MDTSYSEMLLKLKGKEILPNIFLFEPESPKILTSNTLIFNGENKMIVDAGFQHKTQKLLKLKELFNIGSNDILFFSHYHIDHIIGSYVFPESKKMIHQLEKEVLSDKETFLKFCFNNNVGQKELNIWKNHFKNFLSYEGLSDWKELALNNIKSYDTRNGIKIGEFTIHIIHLPGHSPGHCGLYELENRILFIGDIDLTKFGPWYGWRSSNLIDFRRSIIMLKEFISKNDISMIIPSHSQPIKNKEEALILLSQFYKIIDERKNKIIEFIMKNPGVTIEKVRDQSIIYSGKQSVPKFVFKTFELFHIEHHLKELKIENRLYQKKNKIYLN